MLTPLGCTIIDWSTYIAIHEKLGIPAPTRELDAHSFDTKSPASFLATVGGQGPVANLRTAYVSKRTDLIHMVFVVESDDELLSNLHMTRLTCINYGEATLLTGTLTQYIDAIVACSTKHNPLLRLMNALYVYLDRGGFRECFFDYTREADGDKFTIRRR